MGKRSGMAAAGQPVIKDLVLLGGGHSHVIVLKNFGMKPMPGVRITLVTKDVHTAYSGMLPGYIAGHYTYDECHIDLGPLARFAGARLIHCSATGLDLKNKQILFDNRPPLRYDILSVDIGITSSQSVPGASEHATPVKPIDTFNKRWEDMKDRLLASPQSMTVAVVGGGAGGVELLLAMQYGLKRDLQLEGKSLDKLKFRLHCSSGLLPTHSPRAGKIFSRILKERGVEVVSGSPVALVRQDTLFLANGMEYQHDECIWCTQGKAASWLSHTGLALDASGYILVDENLQSTNAPGVFAAGDIHSSALYPREKAGVFAVRQGLPLATNLRAALLGKRLTPFQPQSRWLSLISTGDRYAIASRGHTVFEGAYLWAMKNFIDRSFMDKFSKLPEMLQPEAAELPVARAAGAEALAALAAVPMRCGGCGAKVGASVLSRVLARLEVPSRPEVLVGLDEPDDAAVVRIPLGMVGVHTVDFFRSFIEDPYTFGKVAANHALGDCYAMGAQPISALAIATVPYGLESKAEEDLFQLMSGAMEVLREAGCALVGGHTSEAAELSLGFAVNGAAKENQLLRKGGMQPGDQLLLTKPIGTGTLFAAEMRGKAKGRWIDAAVSSMLLSNQKAASILRTHGATACTDVTGFGLIGHLVEMVKPSAVSVRLKVAAVPLLEGASECVRNGIFSSLQPSNLRLNRAVADIPQVSKFPAYPLLFDPQTAGGLLASVPPRLASTCLQALKRGGYAQASLIGQVEELSDPEGALIFLERG